MNGLPIARMCLSCGEGFWISTEEQDRLRQIAREVGGGDWCLPQRCTGCRFERHREMLRVPEAAEGWHETECRDCGRTFRIGPQDIEYLQARGWAWPRRCRDCRALKRFREGARAYGA